MKERPILFSAPMVRAILDGTKTQTRRVMKPQPQMVTQHRAAQWEGDPSVLRELLGQIGRKCPYGQPGDRLWVRETWGLHAYGDDTDWLKGSCTHLDLEDHVLAYRADWGPLQDSCHWRPSIHMPRAASRITLGITGVRVERLHDISADDARAEGCPDKPVPGAEQASVDLLAKLWFHDLWAQINGQASWDANPWVWVVEFKRIEGATA